MKIDLEDLPVHQNTADSRYARLSCVLGSEGMPVLCQQACATSELTSLQLLPGGMPVSSDCVCQTVTGDAASEEVCPAFTQHHQLPMCCLHTGPSTAARNQACCVCLVHLHCPAQGGRAQRSCRCKCLACVVPERESWPAGL